MKRGRWIALGVVLYLLAGALAITVSPQARAMTRGVYVWLWTHTTPAGTPIPDRFK